MDKSNRWMARGTLLASLLLVGAPVFAQTIAGGIDVWTTPDDGSTKITSFVGSPLPADFFCTGSAAFSQEVKLKGKPIATSDNGLGSTDTVVQRVKDATFDSSGKAATQIQVKALSFEEHAPLTINCADGPHTFKLRVTLDQRSAPPVTDMTITSDGTGTGGTFDATVVVPGKLVFTDTTTGKSLDAVYDRVNPQAAGAAWASNVGTGGVSHPASLTIDTDGDGTPDLTVPGTSNGFHTGWSNHCNPPCPVVIQHQGPHPTWPVPPPPACTRTVVQAANRQLAVAQEDQPGTLTTNTVASYASSATVIGVTSQEVGVTQPVQPCKFTLSDGSLAVVGNAVQTNVSQARR
jgi:hypothetical protein